MTKHAVRNKRVLIRRVRIAIFIRLTRCLILTKIRFVFKIPKRKYDFETDFTATCRLFRHNLIVYYLNIWSHEFCTETRFIVNCTWSFRRARAIKRKKFKKNVLLFFRPKWLEQFSTLKSYHIFVRIKNGTYTRNGRREEGKESGHIF